MFSKSVIAASLVSAVSAHQNFHQFWVNDVSPGYQVAIRMPPSNSPVTDVTSDDITCNVNGNNLTLSALVSTAAASAGDNITVQWDSSSHPGPIQHFLFGPVTNASQATGIGSWVKIDEFIEENGTWANAIMEANDMKYSFNLPSDLASGDYLLRSEMLALHGSQTLGGGQFYIGCAQLTITGTAGDSCSPEIQLPGAYNESDPSIYIPNFYNGFNISTYTPPGGAVATCGTGSASAVATSGIASTTSSAVAVATSSAVSTSTAPQTTSSASLSSVGAQVGIASTSSSSTIASTTAASRSTTSTASSGATSSTSTSTVSAVEMPSGTTLGNLLSWVSSFYSANSDSEYTGSTIARRHARDVVKN